MASPLDGYLTVAQVADHYGVPRKSVVRVIRQGRIKAEKVEGGWQWLIHRNDLPEAWPPPLQAVSGG